MLCANRKQNREPAFADSDPGAEFVCPECREELVLRRGSVRIHHFVHKRQGTCRHGAGETEAHRRCKMGIFQSLQGKPRVRNVAVERSLKTCRPDVSAYINGIPVAIEVQISALSMQTIIRRTAEYARRGIYVLWLPQWRPELDRPRYSPRLWEKWIHAAYFGRVYYWVKGLTVVCYHFHPYETGIPKKSRRPQFSNARGFRSKRYRVPIRGKTLNLATDFFPTKRQWWKGGKFTVPYARLYIHDVKKSASNSARQFR